VPTTIKVQHLDKHDCALKQITERRRWSIGRALEVFNVVARRIIVVLERRRWSSWRALEDFNYVMWFIALGLWAPLVALYFSRSRRIGFRSAVLLEAVDFNLPAPAIRWLLRAGVPIDGAEVWKQPCSPISNFNLTCGLLAALELEYIQANGQTALYIESAHGRENVVRVLLSAGAAVDAAAVRSETAR
jgi:hypothetical protein